jgi:hypothetical protein
VVACSVRGVDGSRKRGDDERKRHQRRHPEKRPTR